jgi:hypothetical protein
MNGFPPMSVTRELEKQEAAKHRKARVDQPSAGRISENFAEFISRDECDGEVISHEAFPGELVMIQSVTNKGKSTKERNVALCHAAGRAFPPLVPSAIERRVWLLNFEGAGGRLRSDLRVMGRVFSEAEMVRIRQNLFISHAPEINDEPLSLSRHLEIVKAEAHAIEPDVIIIDTASAAFNIRNESDNSEVAQIMKSLIQMARQLNCVVVIVHHIGKAKAEDGQTREAAHRGRGASAWADFSSAIFNLEHDQVSGLDTLTCAKRKSGTGENYEIVMRLDRETRWFSPVNEAPPRVLSNRELVLRALGGLDTPISTAGVEQLLEGKMSERTVRNCLKALVTDGLITQPKRGFWKARERITPELGKLGNGHKSLPSCLIPAESGDLGKLGEPLCELPDLPNGESGREWGDLTIEEQEARAIFEEGNKIGFFAERVA